MQPSMYLLFTYLKRPQSILALLAKKISISYVDQEGLTCFTLSRLIALDKMPGVRPIGVGELVRRAISKAIVGFIQDDLKQAADFTQLCAGMEAGCEACNEELFEDPSCEAILVADASYAFNLLNRRQPYSISRPSVPPLQSH